MNQRSPILAIGSSKGGVGKTTLSVCLSCYIAGGGRPVTLIDADPNLNSARWLGLIKESQPVLPVSVQTVGEDRLCSAIRGAAATSLVIIDLPGLLSRAMDRAISVADAILIPMTAGMGGEEETKRTHDACRDQRPTPDFNAAGIVVNVDPRTRVYRETREQMEAYAVPLLQNPLPSRVAYPAAWRNGLNPVTSAPEIIADIAKIAEELGI